MRATTKQSQQGFTSIDIVVQILLLGVALLLTDPFTGKPRAYPPLIETLIMKDLPHLPKPRVQWPVRQVGPGEARRSECSRCCSTT